METAMIRSEAITQLKHVDPCMIVAGLAGHEIAVAAVDEVLDGLGHAPKIARHGTDRHRPH
jgi:hypothetical protein